MKCEEAREQLWPLEEPRLASPGVMEARSHVEQCESCRDFLEQDASLLAALRRCREIEAPPEVREGVLDLLAQEGVGRRPPRSTSRPLVGGFVGLAVALGGIALVSLVAPGSNQGIDQGANTASVQSAFVEDFLRRAVQAEHIETSDPGEVARFLVRELGVATPLPVPIRNFELTGAEVCIVEGVRGAVVLYKQDGRILYHYLIPQQREASAEPRISTVRPPEWSGQAGFPSVVTWGSEQIQQALVGDLPPDELLAMARSLATQG